jgi:hypothetical protein
MEVRSAISNPGAAAVAWPIPDVAPVTTQTLPFISAW